MLFPPSVRIVIDLLDVYSACKGVNLDIHDPMPETGFRRPKDNLTRLIHETGGFQILLVQNNDPRFVRGTMNVLELRTVISGNNVFDVSLGQFQLRVMIFTQLQA